MMDDVKAMIGLVSGPPCCVSLPPNLGATICSGVDDEDDKLKWLTRDLKVWGTAMVMVGGVWLFIVIPYDYDRQQHPSPAGGEPEVVFLATATASAGYTVIDTGGTMVEEWLLRTDEADHLQRLKKPASTWKIDGGEDDG